MGFAMNWKDQVKPLLQRYFKMVEVYDNGTQGANEVSRVRLANGVELVVKTMLAIKIYHQRRKALTEVTMSLLDQGLGGDTVVPPMFAEMFSLTPIYAEHWGQANVEGHRRICQVVRAYAPGGPGDEWRGQVYARTRNLDSADRQCRAVIAHHPDAERISLLDFLTINQDRSARNWVTNGGERFYAIDNGMAWFHEYPESNAWQQGCVVDDVILQVKPWQFISGVFTTTWSGRPLSESLLTAVKNFDEDRFLAGISAAAVELEFPTELSQDWRFEGILRRLRWIAEHERQPTAEEYRAWHRGSPLMTPPEIEATGGKLIWTSEMDR